MKSQTISNIWITLNILLAACMVYCVVSLGLDHKATWIFIILTNFSTGLFLALKYNRKKTG